MAVEIIKETGSIVEGANSYASLDDADSYFETRLNSSTYTLATDDIKKTSLIQATRAIDNYLTHRGYKIHTNQPLAYPRTGVENIELYNEYKHVFPESKLIEAVCELALHMLSDERLVESSLNGIKSLKIAGSIELVAGELTEDSIIPNHIYRILSEYASKKGSNAGNIKTYRG